MYKLVQLRAAPNKHTDSIPEPSLTFFTTTPQTTPLKTFKMYPTTYFAVLATALVTFAGAQTATEPVTGTLGNATVVENNPIGVIYTATLPEKEFFNPEDPRGNIKGSVSATANPDGIGVTFTVSISNLPTSGGPFCKQSFFPYKIYINSS